MATIPKGTKFSVVENLGQPWCKVSYGGYVGTSSLTFTVKVSNVDVQIPAPEAGQKASFTATLGGKWLPSAQH